MSPAHLNGFTEAGKSQLRRVLERAITRRECEAKCGNHADGPHGFCGACGLMLPPQLVQLLGSLHGERYLIAQRSAREWVQGLLAEAADE